MSIGPGEEVDITLDMTKNTKSQMNSTLLTTTTLDLNLSAIPNPKQYVKIEPEDRGKLITIVEQESELALTGS